MSWKPEKFRAGSEEMGALAMVAANGTSFLAGVMALWSLTAGLGLTQTFAVEDGLFSSWMVWAVLAAAFHWVAGEVARVTGVERVGPKFFLMNGLRMADRRLAAVPVPHDR
ncbi:MAG: hypothetical protein NTZ56_08815, partial [Acidobacteria bacterium]|nr:hypothetical protein [Acidobacteriota bacterium]